MSGVTVSLFALSGSAHTRKFEKTYVQTVAFHRSYSCVKYGTYFFEKDFIAFSIDEDIFNLLPSRPSDSMSD